MLLVVLSIATNVGAADRVEINKNGLLRVAQPAEGWQQTDAVITPEAQKYPAAWQQVFRNPGTIVPVETSKKFGAMRDLVHQRKDTVLELGISMTEKDGKKVIDVVKGEGAVIWMETFFNPYIFLWATAMLLMALAWWLIHCEKFNGTLISLIALVVTLLLIIIPALLTGTALVASAAIVALLALFAAVAVDPNVKAFRILVAVFYVAMIGSLIAFYA